MRAFEFVTEALEKGRGTGQARLLSLLREGNGLHVSRVTWGEQGKGRYRLRQRPSPCWPPLSSPGPTGRLFFLAGLREAQST